VLSSNLLFDGVVLAKALVVLVVLAYAIATPGGWERYNVLSLAAHCAGEFSFLISFVTRLLLDVSSTGATPVGQRLAAAGRACAVPLQSAALYVRRWWRNRRARRSMAAESRRRKKNDDDETAVYVALEDTDSDEDEGEPDTSLDVRTIRVIGQELDEITFGAAAFTLYGCLCPSLLTHCVVAVVLFYPFFILWLLAAALATWAFRRRLRALTSAGKRPAEQHPVAAWRLLLEIAAMRVALEFLVTVVVQSSFVDATMLYAFRSTLRGAAGVHRNATMTAALHDPATLRAIVAKEVVVYRLKPPTALWHEMCSNSLSMLTVCTQVFF
jgi:hypothetical protein